MPSSKKKAASKLSAAKKAAAERFVWKPGDVKIIRQGKKS